MKSWKFQSIETVISGFFLIRLIGICNAPLETWHSWRQSLTNMMARNMVEGNYSFLYPRIDMGGARTGIMGSEFPFFQSLIADFDLLFGYEHWYGRIINLIVSSLATYTFFLLVKRWWNERTAWYATLIFLCSLWFSFSRKTMPDTFAVSLVILGIYFFQQYIDKRKLLQLIFGTILITLGGLCKIPAVFLFVLVLPLWMNRSVRLKFKLHISLAVILASTVILNWYFVWVPYLVETYHYALYFPKGILEGLNEIKPFVSDFFLQFYFGALRSYIVLLPLLLGILWLFLKGNRKIALTFAGLTAIFILFAIKTGTVFPTHNYYVLPFVPVMAVLAGIGLQRMKPLWSVILLSLIAIEGIANQWTDFRIKDEVRYRLTIEEQLDTILPRKEKIVIHTGPNPEWMYFYHRKGWSLEPTEFGTKAAFELVKSEGASYVVVDKHAWETPLELSKVGETKDLIVYSLYAQKH